MIASMVYRLVDGASPKDLENAGGRVICAAQSWTLGQMPMVFYGVHPILPP
jgi:hypothetical protein